MTPKQIKKFSFLMNEVYLDMFISDDVSIRSCAKESFEILKESAIERVEYLNNEPYEKYSFTLFSIKTNDTYSITATCNEVVVIGEHAVLVAAFSKKQRLQNKLNLIESHKNYTCDCCNHNANATCNEDTLNELLGMPETENVNIMFGSDNEAINLFEIIRLALVDLDGAAQGNKLIINEIEQLYFREVDYPEEHFTNATLGGALTKH